MTAVPLKEVVEALNELAEHNRSANLPNSAAYVDNLSERIKQHGIAPPDGWVLVPMEPTQEMIDAGIMFGTSPTKVSIIWSNMLAAAPEVSE